MKIHYLFLVLYPQVNNFTVVLDLSVRKKHYNLSEKGLAVQGYDPVAFFAKNR